MTFADDSMMNQALHFEAWISPSSKTSANKSNCLKYQWRMKIENKVFIAGGLVLFILSEYAWVPSIHEAFGQTLW